MVDIKTLLQDLSPDERQIVTDYSNHKNFELLLDVLDIYPLIDVNKMIDTARAFRWKQRHDNVELEFSINHDGCYIHIGVSGLDGNHETFLFDGKMWMWRHAPLSSFNPIAQGQMLVKMILAIRDAS